ncbi:precorrin-2 C(20)-methyltransferase [Secundilactobacillus paracollinoides]|uniref:Precorrin-2 C(20)-methyltransferase n=1 Tax=Secundilactobacillus paracollinoides TaxID=240427 RepID=A0A1B2IYG5_9LACO|nr:cobalt-factor II C(20)-methyltransferase [Secundilactobacillus paracollinoides]ANZ61171.1 precorrin-2 C(20)-methyltransferase [Secundilactobacillus paracollinoides]ANZ64435.1 precorrin-2 C(20)-methyltransferase [Secundilactobacillus paracollinoides]ANZ67092.1 precorrin-2 C(20)-methyltransferase [Secundilactobacillus paracollinoides]KRL76092.1 precorrin-2 C(20)-methyltransferase [Secundilactobacillus paracollinoides DSM 15502 = JCM 11969]
MATFYGIGVGPGDSELMTIKAVNTIKALDVLYAPKAHNDQPSVAEKIAAPYFSAQLTIKRRRFPMVKNLAEKQASWQAIAEEIVTDVQAGNEVGFITLGDASVYSTYSYLLDIIGNRISVETLAGISSYSQIAATISTPLMLDDELLEIIPATADETAIATAIDDNDNVVMMKISANLPLVYALLEKRNLLDHALIISNASMRTQQTVKLSEVDSTEKLPYFSTLLLKKTYAF